MNDHVSICIEQIRRLGFKPGTQLSIFCPKCSGSIKVLSDNLNKIEIEKFLGNHRGCGSCFFGFCDGRRWEIQGGGIETDEPQRIEPVIETTTPEEPLSKPNIGFYAEKDEVFPPPTRPKQEVPIETSGTESINLPVGANPQAEDGHVDIANEIAEALARRNLSAYESRIVWTLFRKTYGWHKKADKISVTQFQEMTGLKRRHVHRTLGELVKRKIVTRIGNSRITTYGFQKDYTRWRDITKRGNDVGIPRVSGEVKRKIVTRIGNRSLPKGVPTKETIQKKIYVQDSKPLRLTFFFLEEIRKNKPDFKQPNLQAWTKDFDLMLRIDNRSADRIEKVIRWVQTDHGDGTGSWKGWAPNILSPGKLREKFDELELKMEATGARKSKSSW